MHSAYQRVLVSRVMQRSMPIGTDGVVVSTILDNYKRSIVMDKHTLVGLEEVEENFRKDLLSGCAYINGPELEGIAKELAKAKTYDRLSFVSLGVVALSIVCAFPLNMPLALFIVFPTFCVCYISFIIRGDVLRDRAERKVELLRGLERRIVDVPNTEEILKLLSNAARE